MHFQFSDTPINYLEAVQEMESRVEEIHVGATEEMIWTLEHPPLYTAGTSAKASDLLSAQFPVFETGRGGEYTYHGPGQAVTYCMMNLKARQSQPDLRAYIKFLEDWIIRTLAELGVTGETRNGRIGIWVKTGQTEKKIAAIGVRVRRWVAYHGFSVNLDPDLSHFGGIVPCGISDYGVTSLKDLGVDISLQEWHNLLHTTFEE